MIDKNSRRSIYRLGTTGTLGLPTNDHSDAKRPPGSVPTMAIGETEDLVLLLLEAIEAEAPEVIRDLQGRTATVKPGSERVSPEEYQGEIKKWKEKHRLNRWRIAEKQADPGEGGSPEDAQRITPAETVLDGLLTYLMIVWRRHGREGFEPQNEEDRELCELAVESLEKRTWKSILRWAFDKREWNELHFAHLEAERDPWIEGLYGDLGEEPRLNPFLETRQESAARVNHLNKGKRASLREYQRRVEKAAVLRGGVQPRLKRNLDHFRWLVRYQAKGEKFWEIADSLTLESSDFDAQDSDRMTTALQDIQTEKRAERKIKRAVQRCADLIGLELRRRPGRPRKK